MPGLCPLSGCVDYVPTRTSSTSYVHGTSSGEGARRHRRRRAAGKKGSREHGVGKEPRYELFGKVRNSASFVTLALCSRSLGYCCVFLSFLFFPSFRVLSGTGSGDPRGVHISFSSWGNSLRAMCVGSDWRVWRGSAHRDKARRSDLCLV